MGLVTREQMLSAANAVAATGNKYYTDRVGRVRSISDLYLPISDPNAVAWFNSNQGGDDILPVAMPAMVTQAPLFSNPPGPSDVVVREAQPAFTRIIGGPSQGSPLLPLSQSPTAEALGYLDDGTPFYSPQPRLPTFDPLNSIGRPNGAGPLRGEGEMSARSELLSRSADSGTGRAFDLPGLGDIGIGDITGGIASIIAALRPVGGTVPRTPPMLPAPPGAVGAVSGAMRGVRGAAGSFAKTVAILTAAGLSTEMAMRLISSGVVKVGGKRKRGITYSELRGFNRMCGLLRKVGMQPKKLHRGPTVKKKC